MRSIKLTPIALDDLAWLVGNDRKLAGRALKLMA